MAFDFSALPGDSKRAAFAKMDRARATKKSTQPAPKRTTGGAAKKFSDVGKLNDGKNTIYPTTGGGWITREQAAELMFGTEGARARIAKANAKRRRK